MEDRETARMRKYGESKTTRIMMATVPHVTYGLGKISDRWIFVDTSVPSKLNNKRKLNYSLPVFFSINIWLWCVLHNARSLSRSRSQLPL